MEDFDNPRKRKHSPPSSPSSQARIQSPPSSPSSQARIQVNRKKTKLMRKIYDNIKKKITDINRNLLTTADIASSSEDLQSKSDSGELVMTWKNKKSRLLRRSILQEKDDCWDKSLSAGLYARMVQDGRKPHELPTAALLVKQIDPSLLLAGDGIANPTHAAPSILANYNYRMIHHTRPSFKYPKEVENFDKFIERRAAIVPLAVCFPYLSSYHRFVSKLGDQKVFRPTPADIVAMKMEMLDGHCAVVTGWGAVWIDGEYVEFWQIQESRGEEFADKGFTRFERHKGIINDVFEFERR